MNNRLHRVDLGMAGKRRQRRVDHRLPTNVPILLGHFPARAMSASGGNNDRRNLARHAFRLPLPQRQPLAHVGAGGEAGNPPKQGSNPRSQIDYIALQHLRAGRIFG